MDRITWRGLCLQRISRLEAEVAELEAWKSLFSEESFGYAWRELAIAFYNLKIEIWKAFI